MRKAIKTPIDAISKIVDYLYDDEEKDYNYNYNYDDDLGARRRHIFRSVKRVAKWLDTLDGGAQ
jgi:hypothetical protein